MIPEEKTPLVQRARVLIVDDVPDNIKVLAGILGSEYEVFFAIDGYMALEVARHQHPDLILLDVIMPGMDGFEVMALLQAEQTLAQIPVIFVTGTPGAEAESAALEAGAVDFIPKPINPSVARARVRVHVKLARKTKELEEMSQRYRKMAEEFKELSIHDALTGLYNRHYLWPLLNQEIARAARDGLALSVAMLDLDFFKKINDQFGHATGDSVLFELGVLLKTRLRESDAAFRYGGEEFLVVLPSTSAQGAAVLCECLRQTLESHSPGGLEPGRVTLSVGISELHKGERAASDLIHRADRALYQAKHTGRNKVVLASLEPDWLSGPFDPKSEAELASAPRPVWVPGQ